MRILSIAALLLILVSTTSAQERSRRNAYTSPADVAAGSRLYRPLCSNCHRQDGRGVVGLGPSLTGELHHAASDADIFDILSDGISGTAMPAFTFDERQTWQVVSFIRSLTAKVGSVPGDAATGALLYRGRGCIRCHRVGEEGGRQGPDLRAAASARSPAELRLSILNSSQTVHPGRFRIRATMADGRTIEGRRLNEDSYSFQILDAQERLVSLDKTKLKKFERLTDSSMPSYEGRLSDQELDDLIAYLYSLAAGE